jgi:competence protein ComEA
MRYAVIDAGEKTDVTLILRGLTICNLLDKYLLMEQPSLGGTKMTRLTTLVLAFVLASSLTFAAEKRVNSATLKAPPSEQKVSGSVRDLKASTGELIDINSASEKQLNAINGVGSEYSERIIAGRPYYSQEQLVTRKVIPSDLYEKIKEQIIAKQAY